MKLLEEQLNTKLFKRNSKGTELTESGKILTLYIKDSIEKLLNAKDIVNSELKRIKLGVPSHVATFYLLDKIKIYMENSKDILFEVTTL